MERRSTLFLVVAGLVCIVALSAAIGTGSAEGSSGHVVPDHGRFIVNFEKPGPSVEAGDELAGYPVVYTSRQDRFVVVEAHDEEAPEELREEAGVSYVEADHVGFASGFTPNDPRYEEQYSPRQVDLPPAWVKARGGTDRPVCIGDSGVRYSHEDLTGSRWKGGYDYANGDSDPWDDNGHGTHVTGIAAAGVDNGVGVAGTGNLAFYHMKILNAEGWGYYSWWIDGIRDCMDEGDVVISLSLGGSSHSRTLEDAVEDAWADGDIVVASAGNEGPCDACIQDHYPAAYDQVIAVTCTDYKEDLCSFSSTGPKAELAAPGDHVHSTTLLDDSSYGDKSGTSMSAPRVAGTAALLWSWEPGLTNAEVRSALQENAQDLGPEGKDDRFGHGEVDVDDVIKPSSVQNFQTQAGGLAAVELAWDPPADEGWWQLTGYEIFRGHPGDPLQHVATTDPGVTSFVDEGPHLLEPQEYRYTVRAANPVPSPLAPPQCEGGQPWGGTLETPAEAVCQVGGQVWTPGSVRAFTDTASERYLVASGTGDANSCGDVFFCFAVAGTGDASGGLAVSATGQADGELEVSGCETVHGHGGTSLACQDVDPSVFSS